LRKKDFSQKNTREVLQDAGMHVVTGAPALEVTYSHMNDEVMPDLALSGVRIADYGGVFAIGGPGALEYLDNKETARIFIEAQQAKNFPYGAICIAPRILAKAGVLKNIHAT
jgi:protease I